MNNENGAGRVVVVVKESKFVALFVSSRTGIYTAKYFHILLLLNITILLYNISHRTIHIIDFQSESKGPQRLSDKCVDEYILYIIQSPGQWCYSEINSEHVFVTDCFKNIMSKKCSTMYVQNIVFYMETIHISTNDKT